MEILVGLCLAQGVYISLQWMKIKKYETAIARAAMYFGYLTAVVKRDYDSSFSTPDFLKSCDKELGL